MPPLAGPWPPLLPRLPCHPYLPKGANGPGNATIPRAPNGPHRLLGDSLVRFGGWPLLSPQRGREGRLSDSPTSLAGIVPTTWGRARGSPCAHLDGGGMGPWPAIPTETRRAPVRRACRLNRLRDFARGPGRHWVGPPSVGVWGCIASRREPIETLGHGQMVFVRLLACVMPHAPAHHSVIEGRPGVAMCRRGEG
jgi:hypothetical protein